MRKRVVAICFIIVLYVVGIVTFIECKEDIQGWIQGGFNKENIKTVEDDITAKFAFRNSWITLNGGFYRLCGMTYVKDPGGTDVYKLQNGAVMYSLRKQDVTRYAESVIQLKRHIEETGNGSLLYVQLPFKIQASSSMPIGAVEYGNQNADEMIEALSGAGIKVLDIRQEIKKNELDYDTLFYKTDHHWKPQTALWTADLIEKVLDNNFGIEQEHVSNTLDNYDIVKYPNWFLGSMGKRTGQLFAGIDDFELLIPKTDTNFTFDAETASGHEHREGEFVDSLIKMDYLKERDFFRWNCYAAYIGGDYLENTVVNHTCKNQSKILLLRDSFSCALEPFLCMNYQTVTAIDLRYFKSASLYEYLQENHFDAIIIAYNPSAFSEITFTFDE